MEFSRGQGGAMSERGMGREERWVVEQRTEENQGDAWKDRASSKDTMRMGGDVVEDRLGPRK